MYRTGFRALPGFKNFIHDDRDWFLNPGSTVLPPGNVLLLVGKSYLCAVARRPTRHVEVPVHDGLADVLVADLPGQNVSVVELLFSHRVSEKLRALICHQLDSLSIRFWRGTGLATSTFYLG